MNPKAEFHLLSHKNLWALKGSRQWLIPYSAQHQSILGWTWEGSQKYMSCHLEGIVIWSPWDGKTNICLYIYIYTSTGKKNLQWSTTASDHGRDSQVHQDWQLPRGLYLENPKHLGVPSSHPQIRRSDICVGLWCCWYQHPSGITRRFVWVSLALHHCASSHLPREKSGLQDLPRFGIVHAHVKEMGFLAHDLKPHHPIHILMWHGWHDTSLPVACQHPTHCWVKVLTEVVSASFCWFWVAVGCSNSNSKSPLCQLSAQDCTGNHYN